MAKTFVRRSTVFEEEVIERSNELVEKYSPVEPSLADGRKGFINSESLRRRVKK